MGNKQAMPMDIVFVINASSSIGKDNFARTINYVADTVTHFSGDIRTGAVVYAHGITHDIQLEKKSGELVSRIRGLPYGGHSAAHTAEAIETGKKSLLAHSPGPARMKVMAVLTDGKSSNPEKTPAEASATKRKGIRIYAIGIGVDSSHSEIKAIASFPNRRYARSFDGFTVASFCEDIKDLLKGTFNVCK